MTASLPIQANGEMYDPAQAEEYLSMLYRHVDWQPGQVISALGIGEKGTTQEGVFRERQIVSPSFIGSIHGHFKRWAQYHVAGFIVPAVLTADAADKGDVKLDKVAALTAIILDIDSGDVTAKAKYAIDRLGQPSMVVASGGKTDAGKFKAHLYWLLSEPNEEVERVAAIRKLLAQKVGGDASFGRATQVVRIPGSVHAKNGTASQCRILDRSDRDYDFDELADIIEGMERMPGLPAPTEPSLPALSLVGGMDFTPRQDTAIAALHRDIDEGGEELTRWGEFSKVAGFHIAEMRNGRMTPDAAWTSLNGWVLTHMNPPWPQARIDTEFRALVSVDVASHGPFPPSVIATHQAMHSGRVPTPATWPIAAAIPPRPWLFGRWLQRGIVTAVIAPGGIGKSSLMSAMGLSMAANRPILGKDIYGGPLRVWSWNLEDGGDNLARSRVAAAMHHKITEADCEGRLFVDSGPEGATLCTATEDRNGFTIIEPEMENITAAIKSLKIDVLIIDPFVSSHAVNENDNNKIDAVAKRWARVAMETGCAVVLVHHSRKMHGEEVSADSARGAGALNNAARMTLVLNRMTQDQADGWGIDPTTAARYFSVADDKHNMAPAERADWFQIVGVNLNNATDTHEADSVGVVTKWQPPRAMDGVEASDLYQVQKIIQAGDYRENAQSKEWAGHVVGRVLNLDSSDAKVKKRINQMLAAWLGTGALKVETRRDEKSMPKNFIAVGHWVGAPAGEAA